MSECLSCVFRLAGTCFVDSTITPPFLCEVHFVTAHFDGKRIISISKSNKRIPKSEFLTVDSCLCSNSESIMAFSASKQANEVALRTEERLQQPLASLSDTFTNNVHPSRGTDNESVDLAGALALKHLGHSRRGAQA